MTSLLLSTAAVAQNASNAVAKTRALPKSVVAMNAPITVNQAVAAPLPATQATASAEAAEPAESAEAKYFKGTVVDELGEPLAGVVVSVVTGKDHFSVTTTTNAEGEYLLQTNVLSPLLLVSYAGYEEIQQRATYAKPLTFQLESIENYDRQLKKRVKSAEKAWHK
ncbi:carboxypeptidase-like regulatory domain-containing protein [Hymenobacter tibetensis]|uniref:Carboxypeptidase-like regulatory domain-containing protein n=1 Tax=Hymenobacter tibetensis TaxID=497967 RepID=A0ABY4D672_9BACT|nr:carboxypeptidase regulatory-like domain-containing protein [Hymenobacter tibetensis]UOG76721.1 carboxypeptidase-like regulatory domain-containing protein [Hymenobacter tibetensis]